MLGILFKVQFQRELAVLVDLNLSIVVEVILESFEGNDEALRQPFYRENLLSFNFEIAALTVVLVLPIEHFSLH